MGNGSCGAMLFIADDYGDNDSGMRCQLPIGHQLPHRERFARYGLPVVVTWIADETPCSVCHGDRYKFNEDMTDIVGTCGSCVGTGLENPPKATRTIAKEDDNAEEG